MAIKVGKKTYPDTAAGIIKDRKLLQAFFKHLKEAMCEENLLFLMAPFEPRTLYVNFFSDTARHGVNVRSSARLDAVRLGEAGTWDSKEWIRIVEEAKQDCSANLNRDVIPRFYESDEFAAYHVKNGGEESDIEGREMVEDPKEKAAAAPKLNNAVAAAAEFHIKDVKTLAAYFAAYRKLGAQKAFVGAKGLLAREGKKWTVEQFNALLVKGGYLKENSGEVTIDMKKAKLLGFEDKKSLPKLIALANAYIMQDPQGAKSAFAELKRETKFAAKFDDLIKTMKRFKVIPA